MKFCFIGYDHSVDIAMRLIQDGHELLKLFTFPCDNEFAYNTQIHELAKHKNVAITETPMTPEDIDDLIAQGCHLFLSAGYPSKIPPISEDKAFAINVHPTYLPRARGVMPLPYVLMHDHEAAGFSIHKMTQEFDAGDILYQQRIMIDDNTDIETLSARIGVYSPHAVSQVVQNIDEHWNNASPQDHDKASEHPTPKNAMRTLNWNDPLDLSCSRGRAFGRFGVIANIENNAGATQKLAVFQMSGWKDEHGHENGTLIRSAPREIVIAISDGYICLQDFKVIG